jgi:hypothetical protein
VEHRKIFGFLLAHGGTRQHFDGTLDSLAAKPEKYRKIYAKLKSPDAMLDQLFCCNAGHYSDYRLPNKQASGFWHNGGSPGCAG